MNVNTADVYDNEHVVLYCIKRPNQLNQRNILHVPQISATDFKRLTIVYEYTPAYNEHKT